MKDVIAEISGLPRTASFALNPLPLTVFAATIAPDGKRYVSNTEGIFTAAPGSTDFVRLCRLDELEVEGRLDQEHGLHHDPFGGVYFSTRGGDKLYRKPDGDAGFHVVHDGLGGMLHGFDYHAPSERLLAGRYSPAAPARLLASRDGESWSILHEWDARHIHDLRINPANGWIYVVVGEGDPRITADSHAVYRSKDGSEFVQLFKSRRPFFFPVNFYQELVILGTDHPEGGNGIYAFEDDGSAGPVSPQALFRFPESHQGLKHAPPFVHFLEWFHGSLFVGINGPSLAFLLRTNNLLDWEVVHSARAPDMVMAYISCSRGGAHPDLLVSGRPGLLIAAVEGEELYGLPLADGRAREDQSAPPRPSVDAEPALAAEETASPASQAEQTPLQRQIDLQQKRIADLQRQCREFANAGAEFSRRLTRARRLLEEAEKKPAALEAEHRRRLAEAAQSLAAAEKRRAALEESYGRRLTEMEQSLAAAEEGRSAVETAFAAERNAMQKAFARERAAMEKNFARERTDAEKRLDHERAEAARALATAEGRRAAMQETAARERTEAARALASAEERRAAIEEDYRRRLAVLAGEKAAALAEADELRIIADRVARMRRETAAMRGTMAATETALVVGQVFAAELVADRTRLRRVVERQRATLAGLRAQQAEAAKSLAATVERQAAAQQQLTRRLAGAVRSFDEAEERHAAIEQSYARQLAEIAAQLEAARNQRLFAKLKVAFERIRPTSRAALLRRGKI